jgi:hypothetical protein
MAAVPGVLSPWGYDLIKAFEGFRCDLCCDRAPCSNIGYIHCGIGVLTSLYRRLFVIRKLRLEYLLKQKPKLVFISNINSFPT